MFLCVETPQSEDGSADLSSVTAAAAEIAPHLADGAIIVNKSTVPVGTVGLVERVVGRADVVVVSNPEFLREGTAVADSLNPDRVVVGADDREAAVRVAELFSDSGAPAVITDATTSELIKYASNAFLATKLTFINTMAGLCEAVGRERARPRDRHRVRQAHRLRVPPAGSGLGRLVPPEGHRRARRDLQLRGLRRLDRPRRDHGQRGPDAPRRRRRSPSRRAARSTARTVAALGLSFKANTGDRRGSPAISITRMLVEEGATVRAFDPTISSEDAGRGRPLAPHGLRLRLRGGRGRARHRAAHRVGGVPLARLHEDPLPGRDPGDRRRAEPSRQRQAAPARLHVLGHRPGVRVVVAGGAGFLGSHLCDALLARGDEVVALDNLSTGLDAATSRPRSASESFTFLERDVSACADVDGAVDAVMNLASPASPPAYLSLPLETLAAGAEGTRRLLELAASALGEVRPGVLERGLRRPDGAPAA